MEVWKDVRGTCGKIQVSSEGRIRSFLRDEGGRILAATPDKKGYLRLSVTINREKLRYKVHRLVAEHFLPMQQEKPQVNHINGNKSDNRVVNLEWVTNIENAGHAISNGLWGNVFLASSRANEARKVKILATSIETGEELLFDSMSDAERALNTRHISDVIKQRRTQANGYRFRYAEGGGA